jgi:deoxyribonuclease V
MKVQQLHRWDLTPKEAVALQKELASTVQHGPPLTQCDRVAGADISYSKSSDVFYAGVVVLRTSDWQVVERQGVVRKAPFPYVPGLLSFREAPAVLDAFATVQTEPDVIMIDGHGYAHPRRFGLACHLGVLLDRPTIGCAKSLLIGTYREPALKAGSRTSLVDHGEVIGKVLRTRDGIRPIFVTVGHRIDLASAVKLVRRSCRGYRIPEPTRQAHLFVNELRQRA